MKNVAWIFSEVEKKVPYPSGDNFMHVAFESEKYDSTVRAHIYSALHEAGTTVRLLRKEAPAERELAPIDFLSAVASRMRYGMFDPLDGRLNAVRDWHGAQIYVPTAVAKDAVRRAISSMTDVSSGGRPEHPAKKWYFERGCDRSGKTIKQLQAEMPKNTDGTPPREGTIRLWEKEFSRQKPPTKSV